MRFDAKRRAVLERIKYLDQDIVRAKEYLESGKHANWEGFRPLFTKKLKDGKELPPHKDWVENVFLPRAVRSLRHAEKVLERLESPAATKSSLRKIHKS
jgi:hypothetical protein